MNKKNKNRIIAVITAVLVLATGVLPFTVSAQVPGLDSLTRVPVILPGEESLLNIFSDSAVQAGAETCVDTATAINAKKSTGRQILGIGLSSADPSDVVDSAINTTAITAALTGCKAAESGINGASSFLSSTVYGTEKTRQALDRIHEAQITLTNAQQENDKHAVDSKKRLWDAIIAQLIMNESRLVVGKLVSQVSKLKNQFVPSYVENLMAVAYQANRISQVTDQKDRQAMIQSMLTDNQFTNQIHPASFALVNKFLGTDITNMRLDDPKFITNMFKAGTSAGDAFYTNEFTRQIAETSQGLARQDAQQEVNYSQYKSIHNCSDVRRSLADEFKQKYNAALAKTNDRKKLADELSIQNATNPSSTSYEDSQKAYKDYYAALDDLNDIPKSTDQPLSKFCDGVQSPGTLIGNSLIGVVTNQTKGISDPQDKNLLAAAQGIAGIASQYLNKWIFSLGDSDSNSSHVVSDTPQPPYNSASGTTTTTFDTASVDDTTKEGASFAFTRRDSNGAITLTWSIPATGGIAKSAKLSGPGVGADAPTGLSGSYDLTITQDTTFTLDKLDGSGKIMKTKTLVVPLHEDTSGGSQSNPDATTNQQQIRGAISYGDPIMPRGAILPRN